MADTGPQAELLLRRNRELGILNQIAQALNRELSSTPEVVELAIEDDGSGFEVDSLPEGRFGLQGMQERARLLGGTMELLSELGSGTPLEVRVPLE